MSAMRVMQQIIRQIFYLSCLIIFVSILHVSNTENNENDDKFTIEQRNEYINVLIIFGGMVIGGLTGVCVAYIICLICERLHRYRLGRRIHAPIRDNEQAINRNERIHGRIFRQISGFLRNRFFRGIRVNNAPIRDNEQAINRNERIDERIFRQIFAFLRNRFFRGIRVNNAPIRDNEQAINRYERIDGRFFRQISGFLRNRFFRGNRVNDASVRDNEPAVVLETI